MTRRSTRRDAEGEAPRLTAADRNTLWLLARLPLLWAGALAQLAGHAGPASTYRQLQRLRADGLVATVRPSQGPGSAPRLYYPTERGLAAAAANLHPAALARHLRVTESDLAARLAGLPPLLAAYRLLAALAASRPGRPVLQEWEQPWRRRYPSPTGKSLLRVELPAYAELRWDGGPAESFLLVPDLGVTPLRVYRGALSRLLVLRGASELELPLVIAVPSERRAEAWTCFLAELAQPRRETPLTARIATWANLADGRADRLRGDRTLSVMPDRAAVQAHQGTLGRSGWVPLRRSSGAAELPAGSRAHQRPRVRSARPPRALGARERTLLELVGRHPFLRTVDLARALGWTPTWTRRRRNRLIALGFLRLIEESEVGEELVAWELVELTEAGLALVAAQQGLRPHAAARYTGLIGAGTDGLAGPRKALLRHIEHTVGAHDCFIRLIEAARDAATIGRDDALVEWRPAAACSRRRIRPDGYGVFRRHGYHYGFFLEFDRRTEKAREYRAKFAAYHDYRDSRAFERDYDGFPTILVVTQDLGPEQRIARAIRAVATGREPVLPVLLTTVERIRRHPDRLLGPVWRTPWAETRRPWLIRAASSRGPAVVGSDHALDPVDHVRDSAAWLEDLQPTWARIW